MAVTPARVMTPGLVFYAESHTYNLDGVIVPSVSQVIADNRLGPDFSRVDPVTLEQARQLGTAIHAALHYSDEGTLDEATLDSRVAPYVEAWQRFLDERKVTLVEMEQRFADRLLQFAGTVDRIAVVDGRPVVIDLKSGTCEGVGYQTAAYAHLADQRRTVQRWAVQLHPERAIPYSVIPCPRLADWSIFRAALELTHERARLGLPWRLEAA
jgi:hypothetical protein